MPNKSNPNIGAEEIAGRASRGEDISSFFTGKFTVVRPIRRVNVDLTEGMLTELDARAARLNVSRQAVIKTLLRQALDQNGASRPGRKRKAS
ncbi:MAG: ribbon-helix-helix protein, CopG family [Bryobacterales bacterium]|nr:ribbon-helix-helix protein, CopG family [Bryobacterales bacterium]